MIYRVNAMSTEVPTVFAEIDKHMLKVIWNLKETSISKTILKKKSKAGRLILKTHYKAKILKTMCYWHKQDI